LYITYPLNIYDRESGMILTKPSRFLEGLEGHTEGWIVEEENQQIENITKKIP
jgi:hypothetical protein